jgi:hypothetical protein
MSFFLRGESLFILKILVRKKSLTSTLMLKQISLTQHKCRWELRFHIFSVDKQTIELLKTFMPYFARGINVDGNNLRINID